MATVFGLICSVSLISSGVFSASSIRKISNSRGVNTLTARLVRKPAQRQLVIDIRAQGDAAFQNIEHGREQRIRRARLRHIAFGAGADRLNRVSRVLMHGEDENPRGVIPLPDALDRLDAAEARHGQIHNDEIGRVSL